MKKTTNQSRTLKGLPFRALLKNVILETLTNDEFANIGKKKIILLRPDDLKKSTAKGRVVSLGEDYTGDLVVGDIVMYDVTAGRAIHWKDRVYWNLAYLDLHTAFEKGTAKDIMKKQVTDYDQETKSAWANPQGIRKV